jgi:RHS repeat-associated protein
MKSERRSCGWHSCMRVAGAWLACVALSCGDAKADTTRTYAYDSQGRVRQIQCDGRTVAYTYDYRGRLYARTESGATVKQLYSDNEAVAEYGTGQRHYVPGPGIDNVLGFHDGSARYLHRDGLDSVMLATDASNRVVERVSYDSFGAPTFRNADYVPAGTTGSAIGNRRLFTARDWEPEVGLYNYRARFYSPGSGRFVSPDPIGLSGGLNLYAYCANNPVNFRDPLGLEACDTASKKSSYPPIIQGSQEQQLWDASTPEQKSWLVNKFSNDPWYYHFPIEETPYRGWDESGNLSDIREDLQDNKDPVSILRLTDINENDNDPLRFGRYHFTSEDIHIDHYGLADNPLGHLWQDGGIKESLEKLGNSLAGQD